MSIWDIALRKRLQQGPSRFELDVRFRSDALRLVLHGPSGAGKTQTLRMIAGMLRPDAGHVRIDAHALLDTARGLDLSPQRRRLGYVFQDYALFPHLDVRQNIGFALAGGWLNPRRRARDPRVEAWLERFGLGGVAGHLPHQLSGGQRQRTALARALVNEPQALLLDEPFAALDKALRRQLRGELLALQQSLQLPLLLITHDDDDVRELAQDVVELDAGRVQPAAAGGPP